MATAKIVLGEKAFRALVRGGEVTIKKALPNGDDVKMILSDIGFGPMTDAVDDAIAKIDLYKPETVKEGE